MDLTNAIAVMICTLFVLGVMTMLIDILIDVTSLVGNVINYGINLYEITVNDRVRDHHNQDRQIDITLANITSKYCNYLNELVEALNNSRRDIGVDDSKYLDYLFAIIDRMRCNVSYINVSGR